MNLHKQEGHTEMARKPIDDGQVLYYRGDIEEITARKQLESVPAESEDGFRELVELLPETIYEMDLTGKVTFVNRSGFERFGYTQQDFDRGLNGFDVIAPEDRVRAKENFVKILKGDKTGLNEYRALRKDGSTFPVIFHSAPVLREGGPVGLRGFIVDITDRKYAEEALRKALDELEKRIKEKTEELAYANEELQAEITERKRTEDALRESEEKYRLLVENATDAIFVVQGEKIAFPNPKAKEMKRSLGVDLGRVSFFNYIHPEDRNIVLERHRRRLRGEKVPSVYTFRLINEDGKELWVELNAVLIEWEGQPATLNFLRNITPLKRLENRLQQVQRMEALGTLAGGIAHDFNNLLMGIQGRISLMIVDTDPSDPHHGELKDIEEIVKTGTDLTKQLLGFARSGKYDVKPTDVNELIQKTSHMFGRTHKEIMIHTSYQEDVWAAEIDPRQIEQVLLNLYLNAAQAMPGRGELLLQTRNVTLKESYVKPYQIEPGRFVKISVTDTGEGMDEATRQRIFEPFFTTKKMGRGTGLGLASVYGIIKNHGGIIDVYSEKGQGTNFNIYLPASDREITSENELPESTLKGTETILLVDDEEKIIDVGERTLRKMGYQVLCARNGKEAIAHYEKNQSKIDIVVLDMIMPEMGGGETYDRLKAINPDVKVILSSGYSMNGQAAEILKRGCDGFIQKPFKMRELSQKIRETLEFKKRAQVFLSSSSHHSTHKGGKIRSQ